MAKISSNDKPVLVGVLKDKRDLGILLKKRWYRIPVFYLPKKKFQYLAFYQPASFDKKGKRIEYYARLKRTKVVKRIDLLPKEPTHPRAQDEYLKCESLKIRKLSNPVKNIIPRRVSFGFTDLKTLRSAKDILELYDVAPTEQIIAKRLKQLGIETKPEFSVSVNSKRFRVDLAIFCKNGKIAIECDNLKAHRGKFQRKKDRVKSAALRGSGWRVIRLKERDIIENLDRCVARVQKSVRVLSGEI